MGRSTRNPAPLAAGGASGRNFAAANFLTEDTRALPNFQTSLRDSADAQAAQTALRLVLGVDAGINGAVAILEASGALLEIYDMPSLADGPAARRTVNAPLLTEVVCNSHAGSAFVEYVGARPKEGAVGAFAFGRSRGVIEGVLAAAGLPVAFLTAPAWKRLACIPLGKDGAKDAARSEAIRRWPERAALFARVSDDGRAEAALIAVSRPIAGRASCLTSPPLVQMQRLKPRNSFEAWHIRLFARWHGFELWAYLPRPWRLRNCQSLRELFSTVRPALISPTTQKPVKTPLYSSHAMTGARLWISWLGLSVSRSLRRSSALSAS